MPDACQHNAEPDDDYSSPACPTCLAEMDRETCWYCHGAGEIDECDDDPVNYGPGEEVRPCPECGHAGFFWACPNVPHEESE